MARSLSELRAALDGTEGDTVPLAFAREILEAAAAALASGIVEAVAVEAARHKRELSDARQLGGHDKSQAFWQGRASGRGQW